MKSQYKMIWLLLLTIVVCGMITWIVKPPERKNPLMAKSDNKLELLRVTPIEAVMHENMVKLYRYENSMDVEGVACEANNYEIHVLPKFDERTKVKDTIELLIRSKLMNNPSSFRLKNLKIDHGVAEIELSVVPGYTSGGSCLMGILSSQMEKTVLQFPEINKVVFVPVEIFQP